MFTKEGGVFLHDLESFLNVIYRAVETISTSTENRSIIIYNLFHLLGRVLTSLYLLISDQLNRSALCQ